MSAPFEQLDSYVPTLKTPRLTLRAHRVEDFPACRDMWADPGVTRYTTGRPSTPQQTWMRVLAYAGHWSLLGFGYWVIAERGTDTYIGEIGFADFKRDIDASFDGVPELGWTVTTDASGRGIATEAAKAVCAWGDAYFTAARMTCLIDDENVASLGVARKCGFEPYGRTSAYGRETVLLARPRA